MDLRYLNDCLHPETFKRNTVAELISILRKDRLKRRISYCSDECDSKQVFGSLLARQILQIQCPAFRTKYIATLISEGNRCSAYTLAREGNDYIGILRRHYLDGCLQSRNAKTGRNSRRTLTDTGIYNQHEEINIDSDTTLAVSGSGDRFTKHASVHNSRTLQENTKGSPPIIILFKVDGAKDGKLFGSYHLEHENNSYCQVKSALSSLQLYRVMEETRGLELNNVIGPKCQK